MRIELNYRFQNKKGEWSSDYYARFVADTNDLAVAVEMLATYLASVRPLSRYDIRLLKPISRTTYLSHYSLPTGVKGFYDVTVDGRTMRAIRRRNK